MFRAGNRCLAQPLARRTVATPNDWRRQPFGLPIVLGLSGGAGDHFLRHGFPEELEPLSGRASVVAPSSSAGENLTALSA